MAAEPVNSWDMRVLLANEATFGTTPNPASSQAVEFVGLRTGPGGENSNVRAKQDRGVGRGWTTGFVSGHTEAVGFSGTVAVKSRSAVDTTPDIDPVYWNAGLYKTTNASTSVVYTIPATPLESIPLTGLSVYRVFGQNTYFYEAEQLRGGVINSLVWSGGNKELMLDFSGRAIGKYVLGYVDSATFANDSTTTGTCSAANSYFIAPGWYQIESEIVKVTAITYGATSFTATRAQLASSGAAHASQIMRPYMPSISYSGSPISESTCTVTIDSIAPRCMEWSINMETGIDLLPPETGSPNIQGPKAGRYKVTGKAKMVLHREYVAMMNKAKNVNSVAITIVQGTGAGAINTFSMPYCRIKPFEVPDTPNDVAVVDVEFEARDNSGNDCLTLTLT